jgi:hypothetical protein
MKPCDAKNLLLKAGYKVEDKRPAKQWFIVQCGVCRSYSSVLITEGSVKQEAVNALVEHQERHKV